MTKMIFVNLPVRDVVRATAFYEALGATLNPQFSNPDVSSMVFSDSITVMLLSHDHFRLFTSKKIADTSDTVEVLNCLSEDSRDAVDATMSKALIAGGREDTGHSKDFGFMYGRRFEDPDGHSFDLMWVDVEAMRSAMNGQALAA